MPKPVVTSLDPNKRSLPNLIPPEKLFQDPDAFLSRPYTRPQTGYKIE